MLDCPEINLTQRENIPLQLFWIIIVFFSGTLATMVEANKLPVTYC